MYLSMYASFTVNDSSRPLWIMFVFSSFLITLIMLNMLIAIMSDTFERVSTNKIEADGRELNSLILE